jgi:DNA-binding beta-propeller fold protein YncE
VTIDAAIAHLAAASSERDVTKPRRTRRSILRPARTDAGETMRQMMRTLPMALAALLLAAVSLTGQAPPSFQVDPLWPRPLPNHWLLGSVTGVAVDAQDHIWVVHRGYDSMTARTEIGAATDPKTAEECCVPAPPVLEFDQAGNLVGHWGGPGTTYEWPVSPGGIAVDQKGNVWIAAAGPPEIPGSANATAGRGRGAATGAATTTPGRSNAAPATTGRSNAAPPKPPDAHVLKFSRTGAFLLQIGKAGKPEGNDSTTGLNKPAGVAIDAAANEVYVADGFGNRRVVVFDAETGAYKRHWGGTGEKPDDAAPPPYDPAAAPGSQFRSVGCARVAKDGKVYVCDRGNDRIQVFDKSGKYLTQAFVSKTTRGTGSVWDLAFSSDPPQRFVYVADGHDQKVFILRRDTLETVGSFGDGGRYPGGFYSVGSVAVDSKGNIYTGETLEGKRVQKFIARAAGR